MIIPSTRLILVDVLQKMVISTATAMTMIVSMISSGATVIGANTEAIPRMNRMLNKSEPTALPSEIPESPFLAAVTEVTSSGSAQQIMQ